MKLACDGRRLRPATADAVLQALALDTVARALAADGFQMQPVRSPRGLPKGRFTIRMTWKRCVAGECQVVRMTHTVEAVPAE